MMFHTDAKGSMLHTFYIEMSCDTLTFVLPVCMECLLYNASIFCALLPTFGLCTQFMMVLLGMRSSWSLLICHCFFDTLQTYV